MHFTQTITDGIAHLGTFTIKKTPITTPEILFLQTKHITAPPQATCLLTTQKTSTDKPSITINTDISPDSSKKNSTTSADGFLIYPKNAPSKCHTSALQTQQKNKLNYRIIPPDKNLISTLDTSKEIGIYILSNTRQIYTNQRQFIKSVMNLRIQIGYEKALYLPAIADPMNLSLFSYMGVDLLDVTTALIAARHHILLFPTGHQPIQHLKTLPCSCPACYQKKPADMTYHLILQHNYEMLTDELKLIKNAISTGSLRNLVETRIRSNPQLTAMLRILDNYFEEYYRDHSPLHRSTPLLATSAESLNRPAVKQYQHRLISRYHKPPSATILLLLPCSAKKPYSTSKSHQLFQRSITHLPNTNSIHEVILTSPLGLVPRELEHIYPSSHYDIPVTGHWTSEEQQMIKNLIQKYLKSNKYQQVIIHLSNPLRDIISSILPTAISTCHDEHPTSDESLQELSQAAKNCCTRVKPVKKATKIKEYVQTVASYQFGELGAEFLCKNTHIKGRYPFFKIINEHSQQLGMITSPRGLISLTLQGGQLIFQSKQYTVLVFNDFKLKGSVFAPGVQKADENIRRGDEVVVVQNDSVCGVGVALMTGAEMTVRTSGEAIKIRHHC